jgi:hypothetical protein
MGITFGDVESQIFYYLFKIFPRVTISNAISPGQFIVDSWTSDNFRACATLFTQIGEFF